MSDNVRRDNRRALPKYLLTILLFGLLGGVLGFFTGVAGAAGVAETVRQALDRVLAVCAPWGIVGSAVVLLGAGWYLYAAAKRRFAAWDGEDEDAMDAAEQQLSWALLLTGLVIILDFFFFAASIIYDRFLPDLILFLASVAVLVVLQHEDRGPGAPDQSGEAGQRLRHEIPEDLDGQLRRGGAGPDRPGLLPGLYGGDQGLHLPVGGPC